jgi:hypothetical protein
MDNDAQSALRSALYRLLRPLARVMLHHGMAYGSFAELTRKAFVDEGLQQLRRAGKRGSISSVAAMTGLTRKEASRLADYDIDQGADNDRRYNRAVRVITGWTVDPRFLDARGQPATLPVQGDNSFETLVREYSGDVPFAAMLSTLETSGTVLSDETGVRLLERAYLPTQTPVANINILGADVAELITTIDHNLTHERGQLLFQRKVSNVSISADSLAQFKALSNQRSQELLEEYHAWLSEHEISADPNEQEDAHYVSVGIYYFDDTIDEENTP